MKLPLKPIAIISVIASALGLFFLFQSNPIGGPLRIIGFGSLSVVFSLFAFSGNQDIKREHISPSYAIAKIITGLTLSILCLGVLYKMQLYPGANSMLLVGCGGSLVSLVLLYLNLYEKKEVKKGHLIENQKTVDKTIAIGIVLLVFLGAIGFMLYKTSDKELIDTIYKNDTKVQERFEKKRLKNLAQ